MEYRPPDKRNAAYESIFGRPSAVHHRPPGGSQSQYTPSVRGSSSIRSVYTQSDAHEYHRQQLQHQQPPPVQQFAQPHFAHPNQGIYYQPPQLGTPSMRSVHAPLPPRPHHTGYPGYGQQRPLSFIEEQQGPPPPPGMTAAQAYQAQVTRQFPFTGQQQQSPPPHPTQHQQPRPGPSPSNNFLLQPLDESFGSGSLDIAFPVPAAAAAPTQNPDLGHMNGQNRRVILDDDSTLSPEDSELPWASEDEPARPVSDASSTLVDHTPHLSDKMPRPLSVATFKQLSPPGKMAVEGASPSSRPHPLQLNLALESRILEDREFTPSPSASISTHASSTSAEPPLALARANSAAHQPPQQGRRSSESSSLRAQTTRQSSLRRERTVQDRSRSVGSTTKPDVSQIATPTQASALGHGQTRSMSGSKRARQPLVYPALLSRVAAALQGRLLTTTHLKDGLEYTDAFTGREAVDKIAYIIKTTDRNLALLLGRALDAQKFFHDVTYDHRLRDSSGEVYRFSNRVAPWSSGEVAAGGEGTEHDETAHTETDSHEPNPEDNVEAEEKLPVGVFTLLTDCYSPTCSRDRLCYSISCPRRVEQQRRLHMKPGGLKKLAEELSDGGDDEEGTGITEAGALWIHSVPQEVIDSVSDTEKKRQEAINEVIYTERDFVRDVEYLHNVYMKPLLEASFLKDPAQFVHEVFWNLSDILAANSKLRDGLIKRQKAYAVVERIGDVLLDTVPFFEPFVAYGGHQLLAKVAFEKEKAENPEFAAFVEEAERRPESRKLELNAYLTKPTTRLARYPLLLEVVLKYTPDDNPDKEDLPKVITMVKDFLRTVNLASGKAENAYNIKQLAEQLSFKPGDTVDLRLQDPAREIIFKGALKKRGGAANESGDLQIFLFDHALIMVKQKTKLDVLKVIRRPIPLELLVVSCPDDPRGPAVNAKAAPSENTKGFPITFSHLGRKGYTILLFASTFVARRKWVENITKQQDELRANSMVFDTTVLSDHFFIPETGRRVHCAVPFNAGRRVAFGAQDGVYLADLHEDQQTHPRQVLSLPDVVQVEVLEAQQILLVLSERTVLAFPLDSLNEKDPRKNHEGQRRISSHINFFRAGTSLGKTLVCVVKTSALSSTIKALEPVGGNLRGRNDTTFRKWVRGANDVLRPYKEFYIPLESSSLHFLKSRICIGCTKGFEIVDLDSLETQGLLDPSDATLDFVKRREGMVRPMSIFRVEQDFLLCYDEFAFYVNKNGWRARGRFIIFWEGAPTSFALHYPYVLAFEPSFIEVRHVETGALMQVIQGSNLRCLFAENPPSTTNTGNAGYSSAHYPARTPYGIAPPAPGFGSRQSVYGQFGAPAPPAAYGYVHGQDRDEIIMVSEDRVMALRLAVGSELQPAVPLQPAAQMSVPNLHMSPMQGGPNMLPPQMSMPSLHHGHHPQHPQHHPQHPQHHPPPGQMWGQPPPNVYPVHHHPGPPPMHNGGGYHHPPAQYAPSLR